MIEFMAEIRSGIDNFNTGGQYLILYLGSLLFLYVTKPRNTAMSEIMHCLSLDLCCFL